MLKRDYKLMTLYKLPFYYGVAFKTPGMYYFAPIPLNLIIRTLHWIYIQVRFGGENT